VLSSAEALRAPWWEKWLGSVNKMFLEAMANASRGIWAKAMSASRHGRPTSTLDDFVVVELEGSTEVLGGRR
jgi:hypothetical protein